MDDELAGHTGDSYCTVKSCPCFHSVYGGFPTLVDNFSDLGDLTSTYGLERATDSSQKAY
jgi:hypothetical protein